MQRFLKTFALIFLLVLPALLVASPLQQARAQTPGETTTNFSQELYPGYFNYTAITVYGPAIVGYATKSNVSIDTAFMTAQQESSFAQTGDIGNSVFYDFGQENYDALLEVPGTYYLVVYSPNASASINGLYIVSYDVNLRNSTTSVAETITIQPGATFTIPLHVETLGSPSEVQIVGASNEVVRYGLLDKSTNNLVFTSPYVTITNFTVLPTVSLGYNLTLNPGLYEMGIQNASPNPAIVYFSYNIVPDYVNPYLLLFGPPSPTGITAYGIYNNSGTVTTYKVTSSSIVGFADISTLKAVDNGSNSAEASLQENTVLQVNNTNGATFTYWPQNVLDFDTATQTVTYRDNVLNTTGDNAQLTNQSIIGAGTTNVDNNNGVIQTYYGNYNSNYTYSYTLPQAWVLYMNETVQQGKGVLIQMGVRGLNSANPNKITWFDNIMVQDPGVAAADFVVNGRSYTPAGADSYIGSFYDAELVFGGGAGGQAAHFQVQAELALFYWDQTEKPFPSLYTFGDDTAEAAYNIVVSTGSDGAATATAGTPYYGVLSNNVNDSFDSLVARAVPGSSGLPSIGLIVAAAIILAIVVLALVIVTRRRAARAEVLEVPPAVQSVPQTVAQPAVAFCHNCGTQIDPAAQFCPNCGARQAQEDVGQPPTPPPAGP